MGGKPWRGGRPEATARRKELGPAPDGMRWIVCYDSAQTPCGCVDGVFLGIDVVAVLAMDDTRECSACHTLWDQDVETAPS